MKERGNPKLVPLPEFMSLNEISTHTLAQVITLLICAIVGYDHSTSFFPTNA